MAGKPNIVYLHSHDTGRQIQPYGYSVSTPRMMEFAKEGVLFRNAFCVAPSCSPSRSALLTGMYPHENGMNGLDHRGDFILNDYKKHILYTLRMAGYNTVLGGLQHVGLDDKTFGFDRILGNSRSPRVREVVPRVETFLNESQEKPFFLDVGFYETHKTIDKYEIDYDTLDTRYCRPPANLPDTPESCLEIAAFAESVKILDKGVGAVLDALNKNNLSDNTLVIITTDHGLPMPASKVSLTDAGTGVLFMMRGPGGFTGGKEIRSMVSHLDLFPTICDYLSIPHPGWLRGESLMPVVNGEKDEVREKLFTELTYHGSYVPSRAVRTKRYKYIRRFDEKSKKMNSDLGPARTFWVENGWPERLYAPEQLYDLYTDPNEAHNLVDNPRLGNILTDMREALRKNMQETNDPLINGFIPPRTWNGLVKYPPE